MKSFKRLCESVLNKDSNPYGAAACPICNTFAIGSCRCSGPHDLEALKKGHGLRCKNGHRFNRDGSISFDPNK